MSPSLLLPPTPSPIPSLRLLFPRVNSARYLVYACVMRAYTHVSAFSKTYRGRVVERKDRGARMHARSRACAAGRQARTHARTHACALLRGSSFLRATDAPIRGRVSFVIRENVNQSLLAFALRSSAPNLPRGALRPSLSFSEPHFLAPAARYLSRSLRIRGSRRDVELWIPFSPLNNESW